MRNYLQQLRQEMGVRLLERIFPNPDGMPSKVCNYYIFTIKCQNLFLVFKPAFFCFL